MAFTHTVTRTVDTGGGTVSKTNTYSGDGRTSRDPTIPDSTTDQLVNISIDISQIKSLYIASSQNVTLETNSAGTPTDTISLLADKPLLWQSDSYYANPFSADVTAIYLTNASGSEAIVNIEVVHDATP